MNLSHMIPMWLETSWETNWEKGIQIAQIWNPPLFYPDIHNLRNESCSSNRHIHWFSLSSAYLWWRCGLKVLLAKLALYIGLVGFWSDPLIMLWLFRSFNISLSSCLKWWCSCLFFVLCLRSIDKCNRKRLVNTMFQLIGKDWIALSINNLLRLIELVLVWWFASTPPANCFVTCWRWVPLTFACSIVVQGFGKRKRKL